MQKARTRAERKATLAALRRAGSEAARPIKVPTSVMEDWDADLQSALVLIQNVKHANGNGNPGDWDIDSALDGVHALVERVAGGIDEDLWNQKARSGRRESVPPGRGTSRAVKPRR
jgi:hypothetical protein